VARARTPCYIDFVQNAFMGVACNTLVACNKVIIAPGVHIYFSETIAKSDKLENSEENIG
jgi:hypothetical protein